MSNKMENPVRCILILSLTVLLSCTKDPSEIKQKYKTWINETIELSERTNDYAVIIDKKKRKLNLYFDGKCIETYPVAFGPNSVDNKIMEGDGCTPEGKYKITRKLDKGQTWFYRAFYINYPNDEDWKRFRKAKQESKIPKDASIGGEIEIHGCGTDTDWTAGCVAMEDKDIDELWDKVKNGTPVTIVGYGNKLRGYAIGTPLRLKK
jgi:murein L,D-transpeptidase YafK